MQICIPVDNDNGLSSTVCAHFGSAPAFMIVNTDDRSCRLLQNQNDHHAHGMCVPVAALQGETVDGIVVGGIGMGALNKLIAADIQVYRADCNTVAEVVDAFNSGALTVMQPGMSCRGHGTH